MILGKFVKQPAEVLDYDIDYGDWLGTDTIFTFSATAETGLTVDSTAVFDSNTQGKVWVSGGTNGATYKVTVTMTSNTGRVKEDEFRIRVKDY